MKMIDELAGDPGNANQVARWVANKEKHADDIREIVVRRSEQGAPLLVGDIADVSIAPMPCQGAVSRDGRGEAVTDMVMMRIGENSRDVVARAKHRLDDIRQSLADDPEAADANLAFARAIGFFGPTDELLDVYEVFVSGGVLGVYFPNTDRLLVRSACSRKSCSSMGIDRLASLGQRHGLG